MQKPSIFLIIILIVFGFSYSCCAEIQIDTQSPFIYPEFSKKISMDFQDVPLVDVLKIFSQQTNLNLITAQSITNKKVTVYLENVPVEQALEQLLRANDLTYELQPNSDIYIVKPLEKPNSLLTRFYYLKHASVPSAKINSTLKIKSSDDETIEEKGNSKELGIVAVITKLLTKKGSIIEDPRTNSLTITDIAPNFVNIERAIAKLDVPLPQILIEVEMLEISKDTSDKLGIKLADTPLSFTGAIRKHVYPWNQNEKIREGLTSLEADEAYTVGTIDASGFSAIFQFLRSQSDTKNLARPRIMTLNNQPAEIKISTDEAIGVSTQTTASQSLASSAVSAERVETGVFLTVTPQANLLTGEITMALDPKVIIARTGSTFNNITYRDPEERGSKSLVRVQSGDTIIMGGLLREETSSTVTKVPLLGDIPFLGGAFRHKDSRTKERELIIFITPHIVNETPVPKTTVANSSRIIREQDAPLSENSDEKQPL